MGAERGLTRAWRAPQSTECSSGAPDPPPPPPIARACAETEPAPSLPLDPTSSLSPLRPRFTFSGDGHTYSVLVDSGFAYVAVAEDG